MYHASQGAHKRIAGLSLHEAANLLGGTVCGEIIRAPGPGHSPRDDTLIVFPASDDPLGFRTHSHAGDDYRVCRAHVQTALGIEARCERRSRPTRGQALRRNILVQDDGGARRRKERDAQWLWTNACPIANTPGLKYLHSRGIDFAPPTLKYLAPSERYPQPAILAPFALPREDGPGEIACPIEVRGVLIIRLTSNCSTKAEGQAAKTMLGSCAGLPIALTGIGDMGGLAIAEGVEDALSIHIATGLGVWAAGCATFLPKLAAPAASQADVITISVDDDRAGRFNSLQLANALRATGREVRLHGGAHES